MRLFMLTLARKMFDASRWETSIVYLSCLVATLVVVFLGFIPDTVKLLILLSLMFTQFCASCWYSLSYIPFGRRTALSLMKRVVGIEEPRTSTYVNVFGGGEST